MKKLMIILIATIFSATVWAHGGDDPVKDLEKNNSRLTTKQQEFSLLNTQEERIDSLESQSAYLRKNVLLLRNLMAKDYPHIKEGMSKYTLDYMEELDDSLAKFRIALKQMKAAMP